LFLWFELLPGFLIGGGFLAAEALGGNAGMLVIIGLVVFGWPMAYLAVCGALYGVVCGVQTLRAMSAAGRQGDWRMALPAIGLLLHLLVLALIAAFKYGLFRL